MAGYDIALNKLSHYHIYMSQVFHMRDLVWNIYLLNLWHERNKGNARKTERYWWFGPLPGRDSRRRGREVLSGMETVAFSINIPCEPKVSDFFWMSRRWWVDLWKAVHRNYMSRSEAIQCCLLPTMTHMGGQNVVGYLSLVSLVDMTVR